MKAGLTIGETARALQLNPRTIRYYEGVGLLPEPRRSPTGYRLYSKQDLERLQLIRRAKLLGLSLAEIKPLVDWATDGRCATLTHQLLSLLERELGEIDQKIQGLANLKGDLRLYCEQLRRRLDSGVEKAGNIPAPSACHCLS